jgi:hypothetical protein
MTSPVEPSVTEFDELIPVSASSSTPSRNQFIRQL